MVEAAAAQLSSPRHYYHPPAPKPHAKPLGLLALVRHLARNPIECWAQQHFEQWQVAGGLPFGHVLLVNHPDAIRRVLLDNSANYRKDLIQRRVLSAGLKDGLLSAEGEQWRVQRRSLAPVFARKAVSDFAPAMARAAGNLVERWSRRGDGATIDAVSEMTQVTLEVLETTIFADGLGCNASDIRRAMKTYFNTIGQIGVFDLLGLPESVPRLAHLKSLRTLRFFDAAIDEIIACRRQRLAERPDDAPHDILSLLLKALDPDTGLSMTEAEVRSNILTFIMAGHETTANTLSWTLFLLAQSPGWQRRVAAEVEREHAGCAGGCVERLVETRAVIEEALRLYPPIAAISRVALAPDRLNGEAVPPGCLVVISPYVIHRHRRLWDHPDAFDPERFLGGARSRIDRFAYLPFGAGARTCIGSAFALQEAAIVLSTIVRHFKFALNPGPPVWPVLRVTLRPGNGLALKITARAGRHGSAAQSSAAALPADPVDAAHRRERLMHLPH